MVDVPGHSKHDLHRTSHSVATLPFHEQIATAIQKEPGTYTLLADRKAKRDLPPVYWNHKVVRDHPDEPVIPLALFMDAVPYSITDSVLGLRCVNLLSGRHFLYGVLRKKNVCRCGCKGWCSYRPMFPMATWSVRALANVAYPAARHDNNNWRLSDRPKEANANKPLPRCAVLYLKGDWAEFAHTLALPTLAVGMNPTWPRGTPPRVLGGCAIGLGMWSEQPRVAKSLRGWPRERSAMSWSSSSITTTSQVAALGVALCRACRGWA